jgi:autotransporter-associated beta strand protein
MHVELARGIQQESDPNYANDSTSGANALSLAHGAPGHLVATIAGTNMSATDKDLYLLGTLSAGNEVTLNVQLPSTSSWNGIVTVVDASGTPVVDTDGNPTDGHFQGTIPADGAYYAEVLPAWSYNGHTYVLTSSMTWASAEAYALELGGHLVTINDQAEQDWLTANFGQLFSPWIGLTDQATAGTWVWSSGQAASYTNWASGQPYNATSYRAYMAGDGTWCVNDSGSSMYGLVELNSAGTGGTGAGPWAQYILGVDVADLVPPQVTAVSPLPVPGGSTNSVLDRLTLTLSKDLDPTTVTSSSFDLREAGPDGVFDTADDVVYSLGVDPYTSGLTVGIPILDGPLGNGDYRFTAKSTLLDRSGNPLDGNGDGTGGDAYVQYFTVALPSGFVFEGRSNDTLATATALPLAEDPVGSGLWMGRGIGSIQTTSDVDYWSFTALAGDAVSVSVDPPPGGSRMLSQAALYNSAGVEAAQDGTYSGGWYITWGSGPNNDAFISHYTIPVSGTYYVAVSGLSTGEYEMHVELARGIQQESDPNYANDSTSGANALSLTTTGSHRSGTIAGTIMAPGDKDYFNLGTVAAGESIFLSLRLPQSSTLVPVVEIRDANNNVVDIAPNPSTSVARFDVTSTGTYYALVVSFSGEGEFGQYLLDAAVWPTGLLQEPDLAVASITLPSSAAIGGVAHLNWSVGNYGTGSTDTVTWYDRVVLSSDNIYGDGDDITLEVAPHTGPLDVSDVYSAQADVIIPQIPPGNYWVFVQTDASNVVSDLFTGNNVRRSDTQISVVDAATWSGGGSDTNWSNAANWGGMAVGANIRLCFSGSNCLSNSNDLSPGTQFNGMTFAADAGAFILNGNATSLGGDITNNSASTQTINLPLMLVGASRTVDTAAGDVILAGPIDESGGSFGLVKTGSGTLTLSGTNSYSGGTTVNDGLFVGESSEALPSGSLLSIGPGGSVVLGTPGTGEPLGLISGGGAVIQGGYGSAINMAAARAVVPAAASASTLTMVATPVSAPATETSTPITPSNDTVVVVGGARVNDTTETPSVPESTPSQGPPVVPPSSIVAPGRPATGGGDGTATPLLVTQSGSVAVRMDTVLTTAPFASVAASRASMSAVSAGSAVIAHDDVLQAEAWAPFVKEAKWLDELPDFRGRVRIAWKPDSVADVLNAVFANYGR